MESHGCRPWSRMAERISRVAAKDFFRPCGAHATLKFPTTAFGRGYVITPLRGYFGINLISSIGQVCQSASVLNWRLRPRRPRCASARYWRGAAAGARGAELMEPRISRCAKYHLPCTLTSLS